MVVAVLIALTVPLAISLRDRARAEKKTEVLASALTIASGFDSETLRAGPALDRKIDRYAEQVGGRVIALDRAASSSPTRKGSPSARTSRRHRVPNCTTMRSTRRLRALRRRSGSAARREPTSGRRGARGRSGTLGAVRISKPIQAVNDAVRRTTIGSSSVVGGIGLVIGL